MILRNYYKIIELIAKGSSENYYAVFKGQTGADMTLRYNSSYGESYAATLGFALSPTISTSNNTSGIQFGTGTTPPTFDDYKLSGSIIAGLTGTLTKDCVNDEDGNFVITISATLTNTNSTDVTIGEIGYSRSFTGRGTTGNSNAYAYILIDRTVLDTPVTIPAGGIGQVTYTIRMNYPTA